MTDFCGTDDECVTSQISNTTAICKEKVQNGFLDPVITWFEAWIYSFRVKYISQNLIILWPRNYFQAIDRQFSDSVVFLCSLLESFTSKMLNFSNCKGKINELHYRNRKSICFNLSGPFFDKNFLKKNESCESLAKFWKLSARSL